jgi:hypothetical protein
MKVKPNEIKKVNGIVYRGGQDLPEQKKVKTESKKIKKDGDK